MRRMKSRLTHAVLVLLLTLVPLGQSATALDTDLPDLGHSAGSIMTPKQERELGRAFMRNVRQNQAVLDDPLITDYIQQLGARLVAHSDGASQNFTFFVIDNPEINAFAGPAGHIGVYTGLILTTETESELAAVLAHEIAHVTQQHLMRAWETASNMQIPNAAILLAAIALGAAAGGDAGIAAAVGGQAALLQEQINFTRANEKEADRIGIDILAKSDFETRALPAFFSRMGKANQFYATEIPEFLLTHPVTTNRIADALGRADNYPYHQQANDLRYQLIRTRLQGRNLPNPNAAVTDYERLLKSGRYRSRTAMEYGRALALVRANRLQEANKAVQELLKKTPKVTEFIVTKASIEARLDQTDKALARLREAVLEKPSSYALNLAYGEVAVAQEEYVAALRQLEDYVQYNDGDPRVYQLMSIAAGEQGDRLKAHRLLAEHHYLNGDLEAAILQLEIASKQAGGSFYDASRVESRLKTLQEELATKEARE